MPILQDVTFLNRREVMFAASFLLGSASALAQQIDNSSWEFNFEKFVSDGLAATKTPGMSVAIVKDGWTFFSQGYGYADIHSKRPVTSNTAFHIASVNGHRRDDDDVVAGRCLSIGRSNREISRFLCCSSGISRQSHNIQLSEVLVRGAALGSSEKRR